MEQKIKQDMVIGYNIRRLRKRTGLTQEQTVAKMQLMECNITRGNYAKIEVGLANIRATEMMALKRIFGVDYGEFSYLSQKNEKRDSAGKCQLYPLPGRRLINF